MGEPARLIDFDAFKRESTGDPLVIRIGGEEIILPAEMPALLALDLSRLQREAGDGKELSDMEIILVGSSIFGGESEFRSLLERHRLNTTDLESLLTSVLREYGLRNPNPAARRRTRAKSNPAARRRTRAKSNSPSSKTGP